METGEKRDETSGEVRVEDGPSDAAPVTAAPDFEPATPKAKAKPKAKSTPQSKSKKKNSSGDGNDEDEDDFQLEEEADDDDFDEDDDGDEDAHAEGDRDESDGVKKKVILLCIHSRCVPAVPFSLTLLEHSRNPSIFLRILRVVLLAPCYSFGFGRAFVDP